MKSRTLTPPALILPAAVVLLALVVGGLLLVTLVNGQEQPVPRRKAPQTAPAGITTQPATGPAAWPHVERKDGTMTWHKPRSDERADERLRLVRNEIADAGMFAADIRDRRVLDALRQVPRHEFVPTGRRYAAYENTPLPIGHGQTISQPYIVGLMTELLEIEPGERVLEIGTGSGYQAAVLTELTPYVCTIEIIKPLQEQAAQRFEALGYRTIRAKLGDGYWGWSELAPFDGIIVTCAAGHVPPPLWDQLKPGGRMVIPIGGVYETQRLLVLEKQPDGSRRSRNVLPVRFVPMTGQVQEG